MSRHDIFTAAINFLVANRKPRPTLASLLSLLALSVSVKSGVAQEASPAASSELTFHSSSNLVLIDVIARNATNGLPDKSLQRDDFEIFDNGHPVPIKIFDTGARTRPLALWLVVQCNMQDWQKEGSGLFAGQTSLFKPALKYIDKQDMVAIAHWCDDGDSRLDLLMSILAPHDDADRPCGCVGHDALPLVGSSGLVGIQYSRWTDRVDARRIRLNDATFAPPHRLS